MNVDVVQTLSLFSFDMIQKTYWKPNEQLFSMGDHVIATCVIKHIEGENSTEQLHAWWRQTVSFWLHSI